MHVIGISTSNRKYSGITIVLKGVGPRCQVSVTITQQFSQAKIIKNSVAL